MSEVKNEGLVIVGWASKYGINLLGRTPKTGTAQLKGRKLTTHGVPLCSHPEALATLAERDAELERLRAKTTTTMGVGSGDGRLFIHGDYESVKAAQGIVIERDMLRGTVDLLNARVAELDAWKAHEMQVMSPLMDYARGVCTGPLGCSLADWLVQDHKQLRAELAAIKEQEPVAWVGAIEGGVPLLTVEPQNWKATPLYAAPAHEAKAQGVVMPERMSLGAASRLGQRFEVRESFCAGANHMRDEVARLNAATVMPEHPFCEYCGGNDEEPQDHCMDCTRPVQQVSVPDGWTAVSDRLPEVDQRLNQECRVGSLSIAPLNVSAVVLVFDGEKVRSTRLEWFDDCLPFPYGITHWMPLPAAPAPGGE